MCKGSVDVSDTLGNTHRLSLLQKKIHFITHPQNPKYHTKIIHEPLLFIYFYMTDIDPNKVENENFVAFELGWRKILARKSFVYLD